MDQEIKLPNVKCTGCSSCANVCPTDSIIMEKDSNGFLYPVILTELCISCRKCVQSCPVLEPCYDNDSSPVCYAAIGDDEIRKASSSGGIFSIIAEYILSNGGAVCGARFDEDNVTVYHNLIDDVDSLPLLQKSKYVQSEIRSVYREIEVVLKNGRTTLFVGCPCQVAGLKKYLNYEYSNLITIDITCHGVPSSDTFKKFTSEISSGILEEASFRNKEHHGWTHTMSLKFSNGVRYYNPGWECPYYKAFLSLLTCRESCGDCLFNKIPRQGDLMLADFWGIGDTHPHLDDKLGTSLVLINNEKGADIFSKIRNKLTVYEEVDINLARSKNWNVFGSSRAHDERDRFLKLIKKHSFSESLRRINDRWFDIGVVSWWYGKNYGSALTGYALYEVLEDLGYDTLMLEWPWKERPFPPIPDNNVRNFASKHYDISKRRTFMELSELNNHIEQFVVGSDQLWNYYDSKEVGYYYFLDFVKPSRKKISYATSFGHSRYRAPQKIIHAQSKFLKSFDHISVREADGVTICEKVFGVKSSHVLDPVFLCPKEKYMTIMSENPSDEEYIFTYILTPSRAAGEKLIKFANSQKKSLIVAVDRQSGYKKNVDKLCLPMEHCVNPTIEEWLSYIHHASLVITDSYHGLCFSLIFNKPVLCIKNRMRGLSRFESLGNLLGIDNILFDSMGVLDSLIDIPQIDYEKVNKILHKEVEHSKLWLSNALASEKNTRRVNGMRLNLNLLNHGLDAIKSRFKTIDELISYARLYKNMFLKDTTPVLFKKWFSKNNVKKIVLNGNTHLARKLKNVLFNIPSIEVKQINFDGCCYGDISDIDVIINLNLQNKIKTIQKLGNETSCIILSVNDLTDIIS